MPGEMQLTVAPSLATTRDNDLDQMSVAPFGGIAAFKEIGSSLPVRLMIRPNFCACIVPIKAWVRLRPASKLRRMASSHSCGEPNPSTIGREPPAIVDQNIQTAERLQNGAFDSCSRIGCGDILGQNQGRVRRFRQFLSYFVQKMFSTTNQSKAAAF